MQFQLVNGQKFMINVSFSVFIYKTFKTFMQAMKLFEVYNKIKNFTTIFVFKHFNSV